MFYSFICSLHRMGGHPPFATRSIDAHRMFAASLPRPAPRRHRTPPPLNCIEIHVHDVERDREPNPEELEKYLKGRWGCRRLQAGNAPVSALPSPSKAGRPTVAWVGVLDQHSMGDIASMAIASCISVSVKAAWDALQDGARRERSMPPSRGAGGGL